MPKSRLLFYSLLSAVLLGVAWPTYGFAPLLFIGFVPLLLMEKLIYVQPAKYKTRHLFFYSYISFILWNLIVNWWIYYASVVGFLAAVFENSLVMAIFFTIAHLVKKNIGKRITNSFIQTLLNGNLVFVIFWITFEYIHHNWDLAYPWLTLGNGLANCPELIQWYEYTGVLGGTLWILLVNIFVFDWIANRMNEKKSLLKNAVILLSLIIVPIVISEIIYFNLGFRKGGKGVNVVVVQPNIDPYNEKFSGNSAEQLQKMMVLAQTKLDSSTKYLVLPETALSETVWENNLNQVSAIQELQRFLKQYPNLTIVVGASTAKLFQKGEKLSPTAEKFRDEEVYYDAFNTAFQLDNSGQIQTYHKSKLVPGAEWMPKPLASLAISLGGTSGSLGTQTDRANFVSRSKTKVAPIICYESIFGEFITEYVKSGAQALFIITNDGWWDDTPGYKQHLIYGRMRAIENRRYVVRCANTGISCFITERGDIEQATSWWQAAVIKGNIRLNEGLTFYTEHGDYIGRAASWLVFLLVLFAIFGRFLNPKKS